MKLVLKIIPINVFQEMRAKQNLSDYILFLFFLENCNLNLTN